MSVIGKTPLLEKEVVLNGKWEIPEHTATGGVAEVYRARLINLDREMAVKVRSFFLLHRFGIVIKREGSLLGRRD